MPESAPSGEAANGPATETGGYALALLDHVELRGPNGPLPLTSRKATALLVYLALQPDRTARRETVAALLWQDADAAGARISLRQALATLRRLAGDGPELLHADAERIRLAPALAIDTDRFDALARTDPAAALALSRTGLAAGFGVRHATAFDEWLAIAQSQWRQRIVAVQLEVLDRVLRDDGDLNEGATVALQLLANDPYNETAHRALMEIYARQGRAALALARYRSLVDLLRRELGVAPEPETRALHDRLRAERRDPAPAAPAAPPDPDPPAGSRPAGRAPCIAVVDDESGLRDAIGGFLRLNGLDVVECANGAALDAALAATAIDLIVLDVTMPGEDGFSIARRIAPSHRIPIIMLTARTELVDRVVGLELGADDYLGKPFELRELVARIRAVLRRTAQHRMAR